MDSNSTPQTPDYFEVVRSQRPTDDAVQSILDRTREDVPSPRRRSWLYLLAAILLGSAAIIAYQHERTTVPAKKQYTEAEVQEAYAQTKVALAYLSSKLDNHESYTTTINHFSKTQKSITQ